MIFNIKDTDAAEGIKYRQSDVAQALGTIENELTANNTRIYLDYQNNKYGYNTDPLRGADTFHPFNAGNKYTQLRTIDGVGGDELPELTGSGYFTITRAWGNTSADEINIYIDGNTVPFTIDGLSCQTFMFNSGVRFSGGIPDNGYYLQILTSETAESDYKITQAATVGTTVLTFEGKGKAVFTPMFGDITLYFSLDGSFLSILPVKANKPVWLTFHERLAFSCANEEEWVQFITYVEK